MAGGAEVGRGLVVNRGWCVSGGDPADTGVVYVCAPTRNRARRQWVDYHDAIYLDIRATRAPILDAICAERAEGETEYVLCAECERVFLWLDGVSSYWDDAEFCSSACAKAGHEAPWK